MIVSKRCNEDEESHRDSDVTPKLQLPGKLLSNWGTICMMMILLGCLSTCALYFNNSITRIGKDDEGEYRYGIRRFNLEIIEPGIQKTEKQQYTTNGERHVSSDVRLILVGVLPRLLTMTEKRILQSAIFFHLNIVLENIVETKSILVDMSSMKIKPTIARYVKDFSELELLITVDGVYYPPPEQDYPTLLKQAFNEEFEELADRLKYNSRKITTVGEAGYFDRLTMIICTGAKLNFGAESSFGSEQDVPQFASSGGAFNSLPLHFDVDSPEDNENESVGGDEKVYSSSANENDLQQNINSNSYGDKTSTLPGKGVPSSSTSSDGDITSALPGKGVQSSSTGSNGNVNKSERNDMDNKSNGKEDSHLKLNKGNPKAKQLRFISGLTLFSICGAAIVWILIRINFKRNTDRMERISAAKQAYGAPYTLNSGTASKSSGMDSRYKGITDTHSAAANYYN